MLMEDEDQLQSVLRESTPPYLHVFQLRCTCSGSHTGFGVQAGIQIRYDLRPSIDNLSLIRPIAGQNSCARRPHLSPTAGDKDATTLGTTMLVSLSCRFSGIVDGNIQADTLAVSSGCVQSSSPAWYSGCRCIIEPGSCS